MDQARKFENQDTRYQSLGTDASLEGAKVKPLMINVGGGGDSGDQIWPKSDLGRAAEGNTFGFLGTGMPGAKNDAGIKGHGDQNQPALQAAGRIQHLPGDSDISMICNAFSGLQLQELDRVFQRTQFPNVFMRKEPGVPATAESQAQSVERSGPEEMSKKPF
ncbi:RGD1560927 (predicted), isoform CRA_a [Rattus norvegicus]|uniref:RGD1560927 (Predicted), isoform CRA_a n=1 Tax=Rattus norvegicus TaxID=10116 RepID=A6JMI1_RAT|nr:RGD1560927 (predicted), isoform CRA_a [Rattus norvegicus]|eukprot:NP_001102785.1 uncharacterized protein LOC501507 [Rattus norvegicus]